jgi:lysophospholipase L1-like esterase
VQGVNAPQRAARSLAATSVGLAAGTVALIAVEAVLARTRPYLTPDSAPPVEGSFGDPDDIPLRLAVIGDSTAAGVGVDLTEDTVGAQVAAAIATDRRVILTSVAIAGSRTGDLGPQVSRALLGRPDVVLMLIGANDATHGTPLARVLAQQSTAVARLRAEGVAVIVGTCPDMGARNFLPPLRQLVAWQGRRVARMQDLAVRETDGETVPLGLICGPQFRADPEALSEDGFHPSAYGYRLWTEALLPTVQRVVGVQSSRNG